MSRIVDPKIRHILCGVDGSGPACRAAEHAAWLAGALTAKLTFLAVAREGKSDASLNSYKTTEGLGDEPVLFLRPQAEDCLIAAQHAALRFGLSTTQRLTRIGKVAPTILSVATEIGADTIVLGKHDHGELHRTIIGSVSRSIIAKSDLRLMQVS